MKYSVKSGLITASLAAASAVLLWSCGGGGYGGTGVSYGGGTTGSSVQLVTCPVGSTVDVTISGSAFSPDSVTVPVNGIVKWTNTDGITHTVSSPRTAPYNNFDQSAPASVGTVCLKFTAAGTFQYFCSIHTTMTGTVTAS